MNDSIYYGLENDYVETFEDERLMEDIYSMIEQLSHDELTQLREKLTETLGL